MTHTLQPGTRVSFTLYGEPHTGSVERHDTSIVWIIDDDGRTRWMHRDSISVAPASPTLCSICGARTTTPATLGDGTAACQLCAIDAQNYGQLHGVDDSAPRPTVYADLAYATPAERRRADRAEHNARNR